MGSPKPHEARGDGNMVPPSGSPCMGYAREELIEIDGYEFTTGGADSLEAIRDLWHELMVYIASLSPHFQTEWSQRPFERRKADLLAKAEQGHIRVDLCSERTGAGTIGYCVSSVVGSVGEIDSLYVRGKHRGKGIGGRLVESALAWMGSVGVSKVTVSVGYGNESVFSFYARFGFLPYVTLLVDRA